MNKEEKPKVIKQPILTSAIETNDANGLCDQKDFDYLKSKGFEIQMNKGAITFSSKSRQFADTVLNIRCEDGKWSCTAVRNWDTKNKDYDASFSAKYNSLDELLSKTEEDFKARANLLEALKR